MAKYLKEQDHDSIIQYASDLHLEFPQNKAFLKANQLICKGDVLLLAGDIVPFVSMEKHKDFFSYISDHFPVSYWIPGNHEYYYFDVAKKSGTINENIRSNVHLVNNLAVNINNARFIFSTLWSKISPANQWEIERGMSDFQVIKYKGYRFSSGQFNYLHEESLLFLEAELKIKTQRKSVVVTHHVPTFMNYPEQYKGDVLSEAFATELFALIDSFGPDYWIYGHHHQNSPPFEIGKTQLLTNQLGYVQMAEHHFFSKEKTILIP